MKLTADQLSKIACILGEKLPNKFKCNLCGEKLLIDPDACLLPHNGFEGGNLVMGSDYPITPLLLVRCSNCHNITFFGLQGFGVVDLSDVLYQK